MNLSNQILNWWFSKWKLYNAIAFFSGAICLFLLYLAALYFKRPIYFFFMIPASIGYLLFLNIIYFGAAYLYFFSTKKLMVTVDSETKRLNMFKLLSCSTIFFNLILLLICLMEFRIIKY